MSQVVRGHGRTARGQRGIGLFASDHRPHVLQDVLIGLTMALGALALVTAFFHHLHLLSSWTGLVGIITGAWGQMISRTTRERFLILLGLGASAVGFFLGMAHGGLFGGVLG